MLSYLDSILESHSAVARTGKFTPTLFSKDHPLNWFLFSISFFFFVKISDSRGYRRGYWGGGNADRGLIPSTFPRNRFHSFQIVFYNAGSKRKRKDWKRDWQTHRQNHLCIEPVTDFRILIITRIIKESGECPLRTVLSAYRRLQRWRTLLTSHRQYIVSIFALILRPVWRPRQCATPTRKKRVRGVEGASSAAGFMGAAGPGWWMPLGSSGAHNIQGFYRYPRMDELSGGLITFRALRWRAIMGSRTLPPGSIVSLSNSLTDINLYCCPDWEAADGWMSLMAYSLMCRRIIWRKWTPIGAVFRPRRFSGSDRCQRQWETISSRRFSIIIPFLFHCRFLVLRLGQFCQDHLGGPSIFTRIWHRLPAQPSPIKIDPAMLNGC